jgi:hypothetical protein
MTRVLTITGAVLIAISFEVSQAKAYEGPWCAIQNFGSGSAYEDCQYATLEACRPHVLAGNRGFCNPNPRWVGTNPPGTKTRAKRKVSSR